ncbi:MAG: aldehyde dehydrogenase (NADP(+)) [Planctomycetota bacterium]
MATLSPSTAVTGRSWIACAPQPEQDATGSVFHATDPSNGQPLEPLFRAATTTDAERAAKQAWEAFHHELERSGTERAELLRVIASKLDALGETLIELARAETGLGRTRLIAERERALRTLEMFADTVEAGHWVRATVDRGDGARRPVPKPDVRSMLRPLGPVAVFGAGNFPLAYSTLGGDTASALATGCSVVVKGHPAHPATGELAAQAAAAAVLELGWHPGTFSFLQGGGEREQELGRTLVEHSCIRAVGFTGSLRGGMALHDAAAGRPDPIPVFAEMGSVNPVFLLPGALGEQADAIGDRLAGSIQNSVGQMCTCPGLIFMVRSDGSEKVLRTISQRFNESAPAPLLSARTRANFNERLATVSRIDGIEVRGGSPQAGHGSASGAHPITASPVLYRTTFDTFNETTTLHEEVFGPAAIAVICQREEQLLEAASAIQGSLTGSVFASGRDAGISRQLQIILERRVGRLIFNGVPTGVEVCESMVHGGPFPATTAPHTTAVGARAMERWCRPVAYQNAPMAMLPAELREGNPLRIARTEDGVPMPPPFDG